MKDEFKKLKRKILLQVIEIIVIALGFGLLIQFVIIDGILQAPFADGFIDLCKKYFNLDYYAARNIYDQLFRNQKPFLLTAGLLLLLIIILYYSLSQLTKYFKEVSTGIDKLVDESGEDIKLTPEMNFMEEKLNFVKGSLEKRAKDAYEAEQRKNELVVYLAHDIRTPLTSVIGYLNLLDEVQDIPMEQKAKYIKITIENALRLEQLINEFFDITRFNIQTIQLNISEINLSYMLFQIADEFFPMLVADGKKVVVNANEGILIFGDAEKLARVFHNILKNAVAFSYENTDIVISVSYDNDSNVKVTFSNKGKVIPVLKLEAVFEKFYRLDDSRSTKTGGAGLGLAIAKEIVHAHHGNIYAESNEIETKFTVILPTALSKS